MKIFSKVLQGIVGGYAAASAVLYMPKIIEESKKNYRDNCDYLLILGSGVIGADTPSEQMLSRMKTAAQYLKENETCVVIPCGGCFRPEQKISEAQLIANYLVESGVDEGRIILEDNSTTTFENFEFAKKIIEEHSGKSVNELKVAFLSSSYHIFRSEHIAFLCGFNNIGKVTAPTGKDMSKRLMREYIVMQELVFKTLKNKLKNNS
ncbi:MAG: YdcF family protein [Clostridia bacterium]|nr:YdcF family protein [Clostridia bacterium]